MGHTLKQRMARHVVGQLTWPDLSSNKRCVGCRHFSTSTVSDSAKAEGFGTCSLVKVHTRKEGKRFKGGDAIACSKWS